MTEKEFDKKWKGADPEELSDEQLQQFKQDCFEMYEHDGFLDTFNSPYDDQGEHNGMKFKVIRRATEYNNETGEGEVDLESMPAWVIRFENGDEACCYPEEICKAEKRTRKDSRKTKDDAKPAKGWKTLDEILQQYFRCSKPFLKNPRKIDGGEYTEYFTRRGSKAYEELVALIEDLGVLGVLRDNPEGIINQLDVIVRGEC